MGDWIWLSALFLLAALVAGTAFLVVRGLALWRTFKAFGVELESTIAPITDAAERLAASSEQASAAPERLDPSLARLRASLAQLAVLRSAIQDVLDAFGRFAAVYPSK